MNMMQMLGIVTLLYFVALAFIIFNAKKINTRIGNFLFIIADVFCYGFWMYGVFANSGRFTVKLLIGQISPLTCVLLPLTCLMSPKVKDYAYSAIAFLNFGLFVAMFISPEHAYLFSFYEEATLSYTAEALCHMLCALFGIYLAVTEQVRADFEHWIKSMIFMYSIITSGVIINYFFHQSLFGMDPYGDYSIYMIDIFGSFGATMAAYYIGVLLVLTLGMQSCHLLKAVSDRIHKSELAGTAETVNGCAPRTEKENTAEDSAVSNDSLV